MVGRIKPSIAPSAAQAEMREIAGRLGQQYVFNRNTSVNVIPLGEAMTGEVRTSLLVLLAAVGVLLLIACSNVANLFLARSAYRRREIAIRTALGASGGAIVRQLLVESVLVAAAGGVLCVFVAKLGIKAFLGLAPVSLLQVSDVPVDKRVFFYTSRRLSDALSRSKPATHKAETIESNRDPIKGLKSEVHGVVLE